jgi:hypothetical protein
LWLLWLLVLVLGKGPGLGRGELQVVVEDGRGEGEMLAKTGRKTGSVVSNRRTMSSRAGRAQEGGRRGPSDVEGSRMGSEFGRQTHSI